MIRRAEPADQSACAEVFVAAYRQAFPSYPAAHYGPWLYRDSIVGEEQWVALRDRKICAVLSVYWPKNFIHSLYVEPRYQGQGIGTRLLDAVLRHATGPCELKCDVANAAAMAFYLRRGWRPVGEGTGDNGAWTRLRL